MNEQLPDQGASADGITLRPEAGKGVFVEEAHGMNINPDFGKPVEHGPYQPVPDDVLQTIGVRGPDASAAYQELTQVSRQQAAVGRTAYPFKVGGPEHAAHDPQAAEKTELMGVLDQAEKVAAKKLNDAQREFKSEA